MLPDCQSAMLAALERGPAHCPPDLFAGPVAGIVAGLKAHAATIGEARASALEHSYPRTRALVRERAFERAVAEHCMRRTVRSRPLRSIGLEFADFFQGVANRLAQLEWAWLESHGAPEANALELGELAVLTPQSVATLGVVRHPAVRLVAIGGPVEFDGTRLDGPTILVTRPGAEVRLDSTSRVVEWLLSSLDRPRALGELLAIDPDATALLLARGALARAVDGRP